MSVHTKVRVEGEGLIDELPDDLADQVSGPYYGQSTAELFDFIERLAKAAGTPGLARFMIGSNEEGDLAEKTLGLTEPKSPGDYAAYDRKREDGINTLGPWHAASEGVTELDALLSTLDSDAEAVQAIDADAREAMQDELLSLRLLLASPEVAGKRFRLSVEN